MDYSAVREMPDGTLYLCEKVGLDTPDYMGKAVFPYRKVNGNLVGTFKTKHRRRLAPTLREALSQVPDTFPYPVYITTKYSLSECVTKIFRVQ